MNRRGFLGALFAAPFVRPLARLLPTEFAYRHRILTPSVLQRLMLEDLKRSTYVLQFRRDAFTFVYPKIGDTLNVRKPARFAVKA